MIGFFYQTTVDFCTRIFSEFDFVHLHRSVMCVCASVCVCCVNMCMSVYLVHMCVCVHADVFVSVYACVRVCMHVSVCVSVFDIFYQQS